MKRRTLLRALTALIAVPLLLAVVALAYLGFFSLDPVTLMRPANQRGDVVVVLLSGDMGLRVGMGPRMAGRFIDAGMPVIVLNSLSYFRTGRTPEEVAAMVRGLIDRADAEFDHKRLVMVGQSFGADALQLGLASLPEAERARIDYVVLVVPTDRIFLRASPNEVLNLIPPDRMAIDTARLIDWVPILCIQGREEVHSLCPLLGHANARRVALPGGHFLHEDVGTVFGTISSVLAANGLYRARTPAG